MLHTPSHSSASAHAGYTHTSSLPERCIGAFDAALRTLLAPPRASRPCPTVPEAHSAAPALSAADKRAAGALMRVNHVGEVCAQALYTAQAFATKNRALHAQHMRSAKEEADHLAWTQQRLYALGARASLLNPLWYAGSFGLGLLAGRLGDRLSLGFVVETERQVEAHLQSHLERLPVADVESRAVVAHMQADEARHAREAQHAGAQELPGPAKAAMRLAAKLMTTVAHRI